MDWAVASSLGGLGFFLWIYYKMRTRRAKTGGSSSSFRRNQEQVATLVYGTIFVVAIVYTGAEIIMARGGGPTPAAVPHVYEGENALTAAAMLSKVSASDPNGQEIIEDVLGEHITDKIAATNVPAKPVGYISVGDKKYPITQQEYQSFKRLSKNSTKWLCSEADFGRERVLFPVMVILNLTYIL